LHSARGPRSQHRLGPCAQRARPTATALAQPGAQRARPATARRVSARRSGHRSPGVRRGAAGGGATATEVEQTMALEHPRRRGYPPGMRVETIAHRGSLSTGRGRKTGSATAFFDEARAPVAGGGPASGWREREVGSTLHGRKGGKKGSGSAHRGRARDGGGGQTATVARSDSVSWLRTRMTTRLRRACARRGNGAARTATARSGRLSEHRRAFPTAPLRRASGVGAWQPRGVSALTGGPGAKAAADRWAQLVSVSRIKNYPRTKISQNK
jgi:hypothetical protein